MAFTPTAITGTTAGANETGLDFTAPVTTFTPTTITGTTAGADVTGQNFVATAAGGGGSLADQGEAAAAGDSLPVGAPGVIVPRV